MKNKMLPIIFLIALLLLLLGVWLWRRGNAAQSATGLPTGEVVYSDTARWERVDKPLLSHEHGLVGKPDYVLRLGQGRKNETIPVEVKSGNRPPQPHWGHLLQLGTYCLLVEAHYGERPSHGLLHYADATLRVPFTPALAAAVLTAATAIRQAQTARSVARSHEQPARCRACGYRDSCGDEALRDDR